jgi:hypothetical protein
VLGNHHRHAEPNAVEKAKTLRHPRRQPATRPPTAPLASPIPRRPTADVTATTTESASPTLSAGASRRQRREPTARRPSDRPQPFTATGSGRRALCVDVRTASTTLPPGQNCTATFTVTGRKATATATSSATPSATPTPHSRRKGDVHHGAAGEPAATPTATSSRTRTATATTSMTPDPDTDQHADRRRLIVRPPAATASCSRVRLHELPRPTVSSALSARPTDGRW